jgi:hypothetical protein
MSYSTAVPQQSQHAASSTWWYKPDSSSACSIHFLRWFLQQLPSISNRHGQPEQTFRMLILTARHVLIRCRFEAQCISHCKHTVLEHSKDLVACSA